MTTDASRLSAVRIVALFALAVSIAVFVLVGFSFSDGGPTPSSVFHGFMLMVVFAAPAVSTLRAPKRAMTMGGAMCVAGAALLPGGNLLGLLMLMPGVVLAWAGIKARPGVEAGWMRLTGTAIALVAGVYFAFDQGVVTRLIALILAVVVGVVNSRN
ncbi:MAG TPA: hypothetical protein VJ950_01845 [Acidimicrobiia bacterium]|nr:hypothetical protein [Acidimicrobiia bacterium]